MTVIFLWGPLSSVSQACLSGSWPPALGPGAMHLACWLLTMASLWVGTWVTDPQAYSPFCIAHPFPWPARPTVAKSKPPTHVKPLKTVSVRKATAIAHWPSASSRHRQSEKQLESLGTQLPFIYMGLPFFKFVGFNLHRGSAFRFVTYQKK